MPRTPNETYQSQFRLDEQAKADIRLIAEWLRDQNGVKPTGANAVRYALREAAKKISRILAKRD